MGRPVRGTTLSGATAAGAGDLVQLKGHNSVGLFVEAQNLDTANDTLDVQLEARVANEWTSVRDDSGSKALTVTTTEFEDPDGDGTFAAFVFIHGVPADEVRARITSFNNASADGDLSVDVYIMGSNWNGPSRPFREVA